MKKILFLMAAAIIAASDAGAAVVQKITLKDGSVLWGYVEKSTETTQTVKTEKAFIVLPNKKVSIMQGVTCKVKELSTLWQEWVDEYPYLAVGTGDNRTIALDNVSCENGQSATKVKVLEQGTVVKYMEIAPNSYTVKRDEVLSIEYIKRPSNALSGVNCTFHLGDGRQFDGEVAEETDSTLSLYMVTGVKQSFLKKDVVKYVYKPINPNQDVFAQAQLLDVVKTTNAEVRGVIMEQDYTTDSDEQNHLLLQLPGGSFQTVKMSDFVEARKEANESYSPKFDVILAEGETKVNRKAVTIDKVHDMKEILVVEKPTETFIVQQGENNSTHIVVEYNNNGVNTELYQMVKAKKGEVKGLKGETLFFTYKDLVNAVYRPVGIETSVNNTTRAEYVVGGKGCFVLYNAKQKKAITIIVE